MVCPDAYAGAVRRRVVARAGGAYPQAHAPGEPATALLPRDDLPGHLRHAARRAARRGRRPAPLRPRQTGVPGDSGSSLGWKRRPRTRGKDRRGQIPNIVSIHDRPAEIAEKLVPGHWEGDTIKGRYNRSAVGTLVERKTLFVTLARMKGTGAEAALQGFSSVLERIDAQRRLSMTYDQGKEMARHEDLTQRTGVKVYFADPHSPWQRGVNENTNGLLRQYLPKGEDLNLYSQDDLDAIAWGLNTRPRKSLDWKCPAEVFLPDFDFVKYWHRTFNPVALQT